MKMLTWTVKMITLAEEEMTRRRWDMSTNQGRGNDTLEVWQIS
jgi:hypothetical protein